MARTNPYGLTDLQWRFVQEYLIDLNATQAYMRAGYKTQAHGARVNSARLLATASISAAIEAEQTARGQRVQLTQDAVLAEIRLLSRSNIIDYQIDDHGDLIVRDGVNPDALRAVSSLKKKIIPTDDGLIYETEVKLWNKPASLRMAGEHLGIFKDGAVESSDIQAAQAAREAALHTIRHQFEQISTRHKHAGEGETP